MRGRTLRGAHRLAAPVAALAIGAAAAACATVEAGRLYRSGTGALDRGDAATAVAELEQAAAIAPEVSAIQNHLGIAYERVGRSDDALRAYERAVELDCDNQAARHNLRALRPDAPTERER